MRAAEQAGGLLEEEFARRNDAPFKVVELRSRQLLNRAPDRR